MTDKEHPKFPDTFGAIRDMSLRDYFAGQALAMGVWCAGQLPESAGQIAGKCYAIADAMIAEREK